jgi:ATP-dependent DNA helicase RecQ
MRVDTRRRRQYLERRLLLRARLQLPVDPLMNERSRSPAGGMSAHALRKTLNDVFGLDALRPGQQEVIDSVMHGQDTLAIMPTGAGKSLCYQLPAMHLPGLTLVVSPLIALMKDQFDKLVAAGVGAMQFNSALSAEDVRETFDKLGRAKRGIVFVTPEQLGNADLIEVLKTPHSSRGTRRVSLVVVDEAHCVSQWGHDFRPAFLQIADAVRALGAPPMLALTATATQGVTDDIVRSLHMRAPRIFHGGVYRDNLHYAVRQVSVAQGKGRASARAAQAKLACIRELLAAHDGAGIIYTATVREAEHLLGVLTEDGVSVALYHGRMPPRERHDAQERFMTGAVRVMVATNAFGMGIDKQDVRFIVHYQMPGSVDAYYQETGRAGRDGKAADCVLLFDLSDRRIQQFLMAGRYPDTELIARVKDQLRAAAKDERHGLTVGELAEKLSDTGRNKLTVALKILTDARQVSRDNARRYYARFDPKYESNVDAMLDRYRHRTERDHAALEQIIGYAQTAQCRWRTILAHFGELAFDRCGTCDNCLNPPHVEPLPETDRVTGPARKTRTAQRAFEKGETVRVRRYGTGQVQFATTDQVAVLFPDGSARTFLARFVARVAR